MSDMRRLLRRFGELGPAEAFRRAISRVDSALDAVTEKRLDLSRGMDLHLDDAPVPLRWRVTLPHRVERTPAQVAACERYLAHRFDLLGSGWVDRGYRDDAPFSVGLLRQLDRPGAQRVRDLVTSGFSPIDWQRDPVSGHRWTEQTWFGDIDTSGARGADIKAPWELARCQHLPQLALAAVAEGTPAELADRCAQEVADTILDFVAANPAGWGANWACAMDAGIRVANWLLAADILHAGGRGLALDTQSVLAASVSEHADFIASHLEHAPGFDGNHYLADVTGLAWAFAYLPSDDARDHWRDFAAGELEAAVEHQFNADGTNFEGSTAYHALSTELLVWGLAVAAASGRSVPQEARCRAARMAGFLNDVTALDGLLVQLGDNDSGRLFKLSPRFTGADLAEQTRDASAVRASAEAFAGGAGLERMLAGVLEVEAPAAPHPSRASEPSALGAYGLPITSGAPQAATVLAGATARVERYTTASGGPSLRDGLHAAGYRDGGYWTWRSERLYLALRCGAIGQAGAGGHDHCDQLAIELWLDGEPIVRDPGTGVYTPDPATRDAYRSVAAHHAPQLHGAEPARLESLFSLPGAVPGVCVRFDAEGFLGYHDGYGTRVWREVRILDDAVLVTDAAEDGSPVAVLERPVPYSPGYGIIEAARTLESPHEAAAQAASADANASEREAR